MFPNAQGGPINNQIAAKAVCFHEASTPEFRTYAAQIVANATAMAAAVADAGVRVVSGAPTTISSSSTCARLMRTSPAATQRGTFRPSASRSTSTRSRSIPAPPYRATGLRIGLPAVTTCGMREKEVGEVGRLLATALQKRDDTAAMGQVRSRIAELGGCLSALSQGGLSRSRVTRYLRRAIDSNRL